MVNPQLLDELEDVIYVSDPVTYELYFLNRAGLSQINADWETVKGEKCYRALQGQEAPCPFCNNHLLRNDDFYVWEFSNPYIKRHFILKDKLIQWENTTARLEVAIDITEKENISKQLEEKLQIEQTINGCISSLISAESLQQAIHTVLESIGSFYKADRAYIFELNFTQSVCSNTYEWCREGISPEIENLQNIPLTTIERWVEVFKSKNGIIIHKLEDIKETYPEEYAVLNPQDIHSLYVVPIFIEDDMFGYIGVDNPRSHPGALTLLDSLSYFVVNEIIKRTMQEKMVYISRHDSLTSLSNRRCYTQRVEELERNGVDCIGVIAGDINGLKQINQDYGHSYGDDVIKKTADVFLRYFDKEWAFRLSGDEFIVLCPEMPRKEFLYKVFEAKQELKQLGVTMGHTWADIDIDIKNLVHHADELMRIEKVAYYEHANTASKRYSPLHTQELLNGIEQKHYLVYLQPMIDVQTGQVIGAEALSRMQDPKKGLLQPGKYIPMLEKSNLIKHLDMYMYESVCEILDRWKKEGRTLVPISLNFSRITMLEPNLIEELLKIHNRYHVDKNLIEIEITETIGEMERETIAEIGASIKAEGFSLSLDDFGSLYTSMSILSVVRFDTLKLDKSLVNNLVDNENNRTMVKHVIEMCREMGGKSIAEGVEKEEQLSLLKTFECDVVQGYLFSKPVPVQEFEKVYLSK